MQFKVLAASAIALAAPALSASCERRDSFGSWQYRVRAGGVSNIPGVCGGLWSNLKQFAACPVGVIAECSDLEGGNMTWEFTVGKGCNSGMVEATWWDATENRWGGINCP
ncbi:hypothetical protein jhhlp_000358 [Lomentospora prolificans]|uniref:Uncharacterized protein n=1 Tax=Lomentospora prolificans TaxID=41688 RepID=A0A2N3NKP9_9PEZI|nr:hypothetical protein jhhlp_000358 [Lomentospora prolificans]